MRRNLATLFLCLLFTSGGSVSGQSPNGSITGIVFDPDGKSILGAEIIVVNDLTGVKYVSASNSDGIYTVANLPPGPYRIQVSKVGFKAIIKPDIVLNVQDALSINFNLPIGASSVVVTVEGGAPLINTTDAAVSTVVDRQFAENLPLNGRSFQTLIQLTPGVVLTGSNPSDSGQFSVNGQRANANYWMVDGVSANFGASSQITLGNGLGGALPSVSVQGGTNSLVSVDALQEFRIQTSTYAPEFGRTPGGQISIVTRSGTNQFHGSGFEYLRNDKFDANDWFANANKLPKPEERQNDFGGTFSGPILRDRTFFFFSYEGLRLRLPQVGETTVPCDSTCQVFGNARTMAAATVQPFLNAYPLPDGPEVFTPCTPNVNGCPASGERPTGTAQFNGSFSNSSTLDSSSIRIDHRFNGKLAAFGRYNYSPSSLLQRGFDFTPLSNVFRADIATQTATIGATWLISPETANDLRFNYSRSDGSGHFSTDTFGGATPLTTLPLPSPFTNLDSQFTFLLASLSGGDALNSGKVQRMVQRQINIVDSFTAQRGSHSLKFGLDFRRLSPIFEPHVYWQNAVFLDVPSAEKGNLLDTDVFSGTNATLLFRNFGAFAQDTWRVRPGLTLTHGLRWDLDFAPSTLNGPGLVAVTGFSLNSFSNLALAPSGTPPFNMRYGSVAPRFGAAWQLSQNQNWGLVLRGGFGVFYDLATQEYGNVIFAGNYPFGAERFTSGGNFPLDSATASPPPNTAASLSSGRGTLTAVDPNLELPYTLQWNVALEQALGKQQTLSASYIGSVGRRLIQSAEVFSPNPSFARALLVSNTATSDYGALQLRFQRRLFHGLQVLGSYTWSHSIDSASAGSAYFLGGNTLVPGTNPNANRGPSDFDIRNGFSVAVTYDIPAPKVNVFANMILRAWSVQNIIQARSAPPVNVYDENFFLLNGGVTLVRPDIVSGIPLYLYGPQYPGGKAINNTPGAVVGGCPDGSQSKGPFCPPPKDSKGNLLGQGNLGRNALRGFGATQWDFAVHRDFPIHESLKLQFRAEMFNVLNHPNFGPPVSDLSGFSGPFGRSTQMLGRSLDAGNQGGGSFSPLYQIGGPRSIQMALKLIF